MNDFNISNNNFYLCVNKFVPFPTDFDTVRVNNCAGTKNRTGTCLLIFPTEPKIGTQTVLTTRKKKYGTAVLRLFFVLLRINCREGLLGEF